MVGNRQLLCFHFCIDDAVDLRLLYTLGVQIAQPADHRHEGFMIATHIELLIARTGRGANHPVRTLTKSYERQVRSVAEYGGVFPHDLRQGQYGSRDLPTCRWRLWRLRECGRGKKNGEKNCDHEHDQPASHWVCIRS